MSDRKPGDEPSTSQLKKDEHQSNVIVKESPTIRDELRAVNSQLKNAIDEIAAMKESHRKDMLEMTEKVTELEAKIARYEMPPKIFKLDVDCVQEIFDYLSIMDIHSVSQTCNRMERIAADYFQPHLAAMKKLYQNSNYYGGIQMSVDDIRNMNGFKELVQKLRIGRQVNDKELRFIVQHCKSLKEIHFGNSQLKATDIEYIKPILSKIETVILKTFEGELYDSLLQFCPNIKSLIINTRKLNVVIGTNNGWLLHNYPTLEHLRIYYHLEIPELGTFFERNPNLQKFTMSARGFLSNINSMLQTKIKIQVLRLINIDENEEIICRHLNQLHGQGFYKQLYFSTKAIDQQKIDRFSSVSGLEKLYLKRSFELLDLNSLINIRELGFGNFYSSGTFPINSESTAKCLVNLERLYFENIKYGFIKPFIQYSVKLKAIKIDWFERRKCIDLFALNKKREQLVGARKVTIYLDENSYLATKWGNKTTELKLIEVKRAESIDWNGAFPT